VSIDASLIGTTAAELMEELPDVEGEIIAVGIIVVVDEDDGTFARTKCSHARKFEQVGLFSEAVDVAKYGEAVEE
jgi:hypothetical protein